MFGWGKKTIPAPTTYERVEAAKAVALAEHAAKVEAVKDARVPRFSSFVEVVEAQFGTDLHPWVMNWFVVNVERPFTAADQIAPPVCTKFRYDDLYDAWQSEIGENGVSRAERWFTMRAIDLLTFVEKMHHDRAKNEFEIGNFAAARGIAMAIQSEFIESPSVRGISDGLFKADAMFAEGDGYDELFEKVVANSRENWTADKRPALFDLPASTAVTLEKVLSGFAMSEELRQPSLWHVWARTPHGNNIKDQIRRKVLEQHVDIAQSEELGALRKHVTRLEAAIMAAGIEIPKI